MRGSKQLPTKNCHSNLNLLAIGLGSFHRGDDEIGFFVLDLLQKKGIQTLRSHGDGLHLIEAWSDKENVCLIDALYDVDQPIGTICTWDLLSSPPDTEIYRYSTHNLDLNTTLALAKTLGRLPKALKLYTISTRSFAPGDTMSPLLKQKAQRLVQMILK